MGLQTEHFQEIHHTFGEKIEIFEKTEYRQVHTQTYDQVKFSFVPIGRLVYGPRAKEIIGYRYENKEKEPPVPARVEINAGEEQEPVLPLPVMAQYKVKGIYDEEKNAEL